MKGKLLSKGNKYDNMGMIELGGGNMKRSKGFTLIELLAVIVILAIIALIATPIILNIINDSREKSNQRSVEGLKKATETTIGEIMMDSDYTGSDIVCKNTEYMTDDEKGYTKEIKSDEKETWCWDTGAPEETIKKVTYSGARVVAKLITFNKEAGEVVIKDAQVGSSSKRYSIEKPENAIKAITSKLDQADDSTIFRDYYGNIRYRGANPNNYVTFNGEKAGWRIIGIVDGKVKLIREESIRYYSWDSSDESVGYGWGVNEWSQADLMKLLNPGYETETIGGSLYWNRTSGKCYTGRENKTSDCDFSSTGLTEEAKQMISESVWYLGGHNSSSDFTLANMQELIDIEKGTSTVQNPIDGITRTTRWTGYIGLMYPSDYGYAADSTCSNDLINYDQEEVCSKTGNWLYNGGYTEWLITPYSYGAYNAWYVGSSGYVSTRFAVHSAYRVRPVLNLKSDVKIIKGSGTKENPYILE